jgi:hypothetical protein
LSQETNPAINPHDAPNSTAFSSNDTFVFHANVAGTDVANTQAVVASSGSFHWLFDAVASPLSMGAHDGQSGQNGGVQIELTALSMGANVGQNIGAGAADIASALPNALTAGQLQAHHDLFIV